MRVLPILSLVAVTAGCFDGSEGLAGLPCTDDASCGELRCEFGFCGGPPVCEGGAQVGDQCYVVGAAGLAVGDGPAALAVADVDGDFVPDIATANAGDGTISLLRGTENSFELLYSAPSGLAAPDDLAVGPIDNGAWQDFFVTERGAGQIAFVPAGDGVATPGEPIAVPSGFAGSRRPLATDVDGDGFVDALVLVDDGVALALADTMGGFVASEPLSLPDVEDYVPRFDDASSAIVDLVAAQANAGVLSVVATEGGVLSLSSETIPSGPAPHRVSLSFHDTTPEPDLVVVGEDGEMRLVAGDPAGWREPSPLYRLGFVPRVVAVGPLDRDLDWDVAVVGERGDGTRDVYLLDNVGDRELGYGGSLGLTDASDVAIADADLDGFAELIVSRADANEVVVIGRMQAPIDPTDPLDPSTPPDDDGVDSGESGSTSNAETGSDTSTPDCPEAAFGDACVISLGTVPLGWPPEALAVTNADGDGLPDLVVADFTGGIAFLAGLDDGKFSQPWSYIPLPEVGYPEDGIDEIALGDFDGAGLPDVVITTLAGNGFAYRIDFDGMLPPTAALLTSSLGIGANNPVTGDFDDALGTDWAVSTWTGLDVHFADGAGMFSAPVNVFEGLPVELTDTQAFVDEASTYLVLAGDTNGTIYTAYATGEATLVQGPELPTELAELSRFAFIGFGDGSGLAAMSSQGAAQASRFDEVLGMPMPIGTDGGTYPTRLRVADLDCDDVHDVLTTVAFDGYRSVMMLRGLGGGEFDAPTYLGAVDASDLAVLPGNCGDIPSRIAVLHSVLGVLEVFAVVR